jgi:hypothetical protein
MEVSGQLDGPAALPPVKVPWYPLDRTLRGPQRRYGRGGEDINSQPPPGIDPQKPDCPARSLVAIPTELSRLKKFYILRLNSGYQKYLQSGTVHDYIHM